MNQNEIHCFVNRYLEAKNCSILEKSPYHFAVKLSPEADRELTNRPYYWSFIDRLNEVPETMSFLFITDPDQYEREYGQQSAPTPAPKPMSREEAVFERAFGAVPVQPVRMPKEHLHFGSSRLQQLFQATKNNGSYVCLYQDHDQKRLNPFTSIPYTVWIGINMKVEYCCDRKKEELYSIGISLVTGHCEEQFHQKLVNLKMVPRLPTNVHIAKNGISFSKAIHIAEQFVEKKIKKQSFDWAEAAKERLDEEFARMKSYYEPLIQSSSDEEQKAKYKEQYQKREEEIRWQYEPRITVSVINCGLFHLEGIE